MDQEYFGRKFGFTTVQWEIKNYCIPQGNDHKEWTIRSPAFEVKGFRLTRWDMSFTRTYVSKDKYDVVFALQRLECQPFLQDAWVDCILVYSDHCGEPIEAEIQHCFGVNKIFKANLRHAGITPVGSIHLDVFKVKCEILVYFSDVSETIPLCENNGIKRLSEDLHNLYDSGAYHDLQLQLVSDNNVFAHKAILFYRITNQQFKNQITEDAEVIIIDDFASESVEKVVRFLYSGNMLHSVTLPAISVFKFAELLNVKPIVKYYNPDEIKMITTIEVEEYLSSWTIEDFYGQDENLLTGPVMTNRAGNISFGLKVYPKGFGKRAQHVGILFYVQSNISKDFCVEIFLKDEFDDRLSFRSHRKTISNELFGDRQFVEYDKVGSYLINDSLTIGLRLRIETGTESFSNDESTASYEHIPAQMNYDRLSRDILSLYQDKKFHDMRIEFNEHDTVFYAHEFFLYERCVALHHAFKSNNLTYFNNINCGVIQEMFSFLYSGKLDENISLDDIFSLYHTASNFNLVTLRTVVTERLQVSLSTSNAKNIYEFADLESIETLKDSARNYMEENNLND